MPELDGVLFDSPHAGGDEGGSGEFHKAGAAAVVGALGILEPMVFGVSHEIAASGFERLIFGDAHLINRFARISRRCGSGQSRSSAQLPGGALGRR